MFDNYMHNIHGLANIVNYLLIMDQYIPTSISYYI